MTAHIIAPDHIHIVFDNGESTTIYRSQPNFEAVVEAVRDQNWKLAFAIAFPINEVKSKLSDATKHITDRVTIEHGIVSLDGVPVHGTLVERMLTMIHDGFDVVHMGLFLTNLNENPSFRAVHELYGFLEKSKLPITEDGCFLAYKRVSGKFKDLYSKTFDNSPGATVEMTRNTVNENKHQTCSQGLHFCAHSYLPSYGNYGSNKTVIVKINPMDVVSIPVDYNNAKGRCCKYVVVCEIKNDGKTAMPIPEARIEDTQVMNVTPGAVRQLKLDKRFPNLLLVLTTHLTIEDAAKSTGVQKSDIRRVCNGGRKSAGGFGWKWVEYDSKPLDVDDTYEEEQDDIGNEIDIDNWHRMFNPMGRKSYL